MYIFQEERKTHIVYKSTFCATILVEQENGNVFLYICTITIVLSQSRHGIAFTFLLEVVLDGGAIYTYVAVSLFLSFSSMYARSHGKIIICNKCRSLLPLNWENESSSRTNTFLLEISFNIHACTYVTLQNEILLKLFVNVCEFPTM